MQEKTRRLIEIWLGFTHADLNNIMEWYRLAHHTMFIKCPIDVKHCHKTKKKILEMCHIFNEVKYGRL